MATLGFAEITVPEGLDGPDAPAAIATMVEDLDPHLVQHVADSAERDDRLDDAPVPTIAVSTGDGTVWIKTATGPSVWMTVWEPPPDWQPITLATGFSAGDGTPEIRIEANGRCHLRGRVVHTDGSDINTFSGVKLGDVPVAARPAKLANLSGGASLGGTPVNGVLRVEVFGSTTSNALGGVGTIAAYTQDGQADASTGGVDWIDISGSYWLD